jgi:hypothetical protein
MSVPEYGVHLGLDWSCANETESFCVDPFGENKVADTTWSELESAIAIEDEHPSATSADARVDANRRPGRNPGRRLAGR